MQHAGPSSPPPPKAQQQAAAAAASARTRAAGQRGFAGYTPSTHHSLADAHDGPWEHESGAAAPQPPAPAPTGEAPGTGAHDDEAEADAQATAGAAERHPQEEQDWMTQMVREPEGAPAQDEEGRAAAAEEQLQLQRRLEEADAAPSAADASNAGMEFPSTSSDAMAAVMRLAQAASSYDATDAGAAGERGGEWPGAEQEGMPAGENTQGEGEQSGRRPLSTSKRAAQNRAAQRAFRERRDKRVKELEQRIKLLEPTQLYAHELRVRLAEANNYAHQLRDMLLARGVPEEELPSPPNHEEPQAPPLDIAVDDTEAAGSPADGEAGPSKKRRKSGKTKSPQMQPEYAHHPDDASMLDLAAAATAPHAQHETDGLEWLEQHQAQAHGHMHHQGAGNEEALDSLSAVAVEAAAAAAHAAAHEHAAQDEAQARAELLEHEAQHGQGEQEMREPPQLEEPAELLESHAEDDAAAAHEAAMAAA